MVALSIALLALVFLGPIIVPLKGWGYFVRKMGYRKGTIFTFVSMACMVIICWTPAIVAIAS